MPVRINTEAVYVTAREGLLINGQTLRRGDRLPADSPLRQNPHRLALLVKLRHLTQEAGLETTQPAATKAPIQRRKPTQVRRKARKAATASVALTTLTQAELQERLRERGLKTSGNKSVLRQRLQKAGVA